MKSNPFEASVPPANMPDSDVAAQLKSVSFPVLVLHLVRFSLAYCVLIILPLFVPPYFIDFFNEFDIQLPVISQVYVSTSTLWQRYF